MNQIRKKRLYFVFAILAGVSVAIALMLYALNQNINLFYSPSQVVAGEAPVNHSFRIGGLVEKGSVHRVPDSLKVSFVLTDTAKQVTVTYQGILPDLFREGQGIVADGKLNKNGIFVAQQVLAKHDEKYMPPEVTSAIEQAKKMKKNKPSMN